MTIQSVSFSSFNTPNYKVSEKSANKNIQVKQNIEKDYFTRSQIKTKERKKHLKNMRNVIVAFCTGAASVLSINTAVDVINKQPAVVIVPYEGIEELENTADLYNSDVEAIIDINNLDKKDDNSNPTTIIIPGLYNNLDKNIINIQKKLYGKNLSPEKRNELEEELKKYEEKKQLQNAIATVYTDGKYVYYEIKNFSEDETQLDTYGVNVEDFKKIFDIKDNAIRKNNDISYSWELNEIDGSHYKDYTTSCIYPGDTIKVPVSEVKTDNINFDLI